MTVHCKWQDAHRGCEPQGEGLMPDLIKLLHPPLSSHLMYLVIERTNDEDTILSLRWETSFLMFNPLHLLLFMVFFYGLSVALRDMESSKITRYKPCEAHLNLSCATLADMWKHCIEAFVFLTYRDIHIWMIWKFDILHVKCYLFIYFSSFLKT